MFIYDLENLVFCTDITDQSNSFHQWVSECVEFNVRLNTPRSFLVQVFPANHLAQLIKENDVHKTSEWVECVVFNVPLI